MDAATIEREIRRLAPWYYRFDLQGVSTAITPPCDPDGHREIACPPIFEGFWRGKTVLDVACAEGAWGFGALEHGAAHVDAFDCRAVNIEKARFVAKVLGHERIDFHVESCDSWIEKHGDRQYDLVFLCGILYHLPEPWRTIGRYANVAREWIYVVSLVHGGDGEGYTRVAEPDHISASAGSLDSLVPDSVDTLIGEFAKHGFLPVHVEETRAGSFGGGCCLVLGNCRGWSGCRWEAGGGRSPADVDLYLVPAPRPGGGDRRRPLDLYCTVYNRTAAARALTGDVVVRGAEGVIDCQGPLPIELPARVAVREDPPSVSRTHVVSLDPTGAAGERRVEVQLREPGSEATVCEARLVFPPERASP